ncbi:MAG: hypothetical protein M3141_04645 [Actinomycetota bacterium]|nr:hypothetical protein [Actinomycetota bacterium]
MAGGIGVVAVAMLGAIGTGLGERALDVLEGDEEKPLISHSAEELISQCGTDLFVPAPRAQALLSGEAPSPTDWSAFRSANDATVSSPDAVEVSIQGESARTVTLTRIEFDVDRRPRPAGLTFSNPCGGPISGRFVAADLDRVPVRVISSADDPEAEYVPPGYQGPSYRPIRFPWTVSLTDSLLLYVIANTRDCLCTWRAGIHWRSGAKAGVLEIDNGGKGYRVAGTPPVPDYVRDTRTPSGWRRLAG